MRIPLPLVSGPTATPAGCGGCAAPEPAGGAGTDLTDTEPVPAPPERSHPDSLLSAEVFTLPLDGGRHLVYAPLRRAAFVTNAAGVNALADLQTGRQATDPGLDGLLRELGIVGGGPDPEPDDLHTGPPEPTSITLFLTTSCNLRCHYCYASAGDTRAARMSLDTARRGIDHVVGNAVRSGEREIELDFHGGGEPSLNWDVLTGALEYARAVAEPHGIRVSAALGTNGVLRDAQVDWMVENLDSATVSMDGRPEVHDRHRPRVGGQPSSPALLRSLERLDRAGFRYGIRMTVTADAIDELPDSVAFLCSRFAPRRIQAEPAFPLGRWTAEPSAESASFLDAFRAARDHADRYGVELLYSAARLGLLTNHFCGVSRDTFALSPDGNVSACYEVFSEDQPHAERFFWARPDDAGGYRVDQGVVDGLRSHAGGHKQFCRGCFAKWSCAGDCLHKSVSTGDGRFRGSDRCHITRELTKDQILRAIEQSGGVVWHDGPGGPDEEGER